MIKAECRLDDQTMQVDFDAEPWFSQAGESELNGLYNCGFAGDYQADQVAMDSADWDEELAELFTICDRNAVTGFDCSINKDQAVAWLKENRPEIIRTV